MPAGPIALEPLGALPDGRLTYQLKRPLPDGRTELVLQPTELLRKLATLVPPPRRNLVRYHELFAPHPALRAKVVAGASACARNCSPDGPAPQPEPAAPPERRDREVRRVDGNPHYRPYRPDGSPKLRPTEAGSEAG